MKRELFFLLLCILFLVLWYQSEAVECFQSGGGNPPMNVPKAGPEVAAIGDGGPKPFAPPSNALLAPPPGQTASVNSYPYDDPANKKAPLKQLKNIMETIDGFLANEAPALKESSDPAVQLPLQTAASDLQRLKDEVSVIDRNPGIEGTLTIGDLNGINANLAFLQKKWRLSANSSVEGFQNPLSGLSGGGSPVADPLNSIAANSCGSGQVAFVNGGSSSCVTIGAACSSGGTGGSGYIYTENGTCSAVGASCAGGKVYNSSGRCIASGSPGGGTTSSGTTSSGGTSSGGTSGTSSGTSGSSRKITLAELKTLQVNISAFITQLQNSGTVNAVINQRINVLNIILRQVMDYQTQVETGRMKASDIPITYSDYKAFLPFVDINDPTTNMNNPLPHLLNATGASASLSNLFPFFFSGDISGAQLARELFEKYAKNLFTDVGYDVNVKLNKKSDSERKVAEEVAKALANGTLGKNSKLAFDSDGDEDGNINGNAPNSTVAGMFNSIIQAITGKNPAEDSAAGSGNSSVSLTTNSPPSAPGHFNWKDRSKEICDQVKKRGLNAYDYGCLNNPDDVGENFSYRGYARMVCARLETNYDPSIPGLCGCPPPTWPGWRP